MYRSHFKLLVTNVRTVLIFVELVDAIRSPKSMWCHLTYNAASKRVRGGNIAYPCNGNSLFTIAGSLMKMNTYCNYIIGVTVCPAEADISLEASAASLNSHCRSCQRLPKMLRSKAAQLFHATFRTVPKQTVSDPPLLAIGKGLRSKTIGKEIIAYCDTD